MTHPYKTLPPKAFWSTGVVRTDPETLPGLYTPRITITQNTRIATAGSCFAQHIGRTLRAAGCAVQDAEPAPEIMSDTVAHRFGYRLFSGRYGNIYTARQMRQLLDEAADGEADPRLVWQNDNRFRDALRPTVEPDGLSSLNEVLLHRNYHLERTSRMLRDVDVFVFTLGLTEGWIDRATDRALPLCPGVAAGTFDAKAHLFHNFTTAEIMTDLSAIHRTLRRFNPAMQLLLTVSPVPLTATASGHHVLSASSAAKAKLRAAVADFTATHKRTDYFPSYEIITQKGAGGPYFAPNMRSVSQIGITKVMDHFFTAHGLHDFIAHVPRDASAIPDAPPATLDDDDSHCDDILLDAFAT